MIQGLMTAIRNHILDDGDRGVATFALILSITLFVGFDLVMFVSSRISSIAHWICWLYFCWMHSAKLLRCNIDRRNNPYWMKRTNNITEAIGAAIGFTLLWSPWQGQLKGVVISFVLAYAVSIISGAIELDSKKHDSTPARVKRMVWRENNNTTNCVVCQDLFYIGDTYLRMPCQHTLHDDCGRTWFKESQECPVCRVSCK